MLKTPILLPPPDFPPGLSQPVLRALAKAKITRLHLLGNMTEKEFASLHGIGPKAIRLISMAMKQHGVVWRL